MLNQIVLVGRIVRDPELQQLDNEKEVANVTLAVQRAYKNEEGIYETDFIDCSIWNDVAKHTTEYCKKGDIVGIKGRLQTDSYEKEDGTKVVKLNVVGERVTFLTSKSQEQNQDKEQDVER